MCLPYRDTCSLPIDKGEGDGKAGTRFGYNPKKELCQKFKFTGMGGNENNFSSKNECSKACVKVSGRGNLLKRECQSNNVYMH